MTTAEIKRHSGIPSLFINRDAVVQMSYITHFREQKKDRTDVLPPDRLQSCLVGINIHRFDKKSSEFLKYF